MSIYSRLFFLISTPSIAHNTTAIIQRGNYLKNLNICFHNKVEIPLEEVITFIEACRAAENLKRVFLDGNCIPFVGILSNPSITKFSSDTDLDLWGDIISHYPHITDFSFDERQGIILTPENTNSIVTSVSKIISRVKSLEIGRCGRGAGCPLLPLISSELRSSQTLTKLRFTELLTYDMLDVIYGLLPSMSNLKSIYLDLEDLVLLDKHSDMLSYALEQDTALDSISLVRYIIDRSHSSSLRLINVLGSRPWRKLKLVLVGNHMRWPYTFRERLRTNVTIRSLHLSPQPESDFLREILALPNLEELSFERELKTVHYEELRRVAGKPLKKLKLVKDPGDPDITQIMNILPLFRLEKLHIKSRGDASIFSPLLRKIPTLKMFAADEYSSVFWKFYKLDRHSFSDLTDIIDYLQRENTILCDIRYPINDKNVDATTKLAGLFCRNQRLAKVQWCPSLFSITPDLIKEKVVLLFRFQYMKEGSLLSWFPREIMIHIINFVL